MKRLYRLLSRWSHRQHIKDLDRAIDFHQRQLAALPAEIARLEQARKWHVGRASTLSERRNTVNWNLGR